MIGAEEHDQGGSERADRIANVVERRTEHVAVLFIVGMIRKKS